MKEKGCEGVKMEGGEEMEEKVEFIVRRGIKVLGNVGMMKKKVNKVGGFS